MLVHLLLNDTTTEVLAKLFLYDSVPAQHTGVSLGLSAIVHALCQRVSLRQVTRVANVLATSQGDHAPVMSHPDLSS